MPVKTPKILFYLVVFIGLLIPLTFARAQVFSERADWGPNVYGLGGCSATAFDGMDSFLANPAGLGTYEGSTAFGASYQRLPNDLGSWSAGLVDGTNGIVGGLQFNWLDEGRPRRQTYSAAAAYRSRWVWLGTALNAYKFSKLAPGAGWHFSGSAGLIIPVPGGLTFGAYGKNFLDTEKDHYLPPAFGGGVSYLIPQLAKLYAEASRRFIIENQDWNVSYGAELLLKDYFRVRGGYHWNRSHEENLWSVGAALSAPKINLAFTYSQTTEHNLAGYGFDAVVKF